MSFIKVDLNQINETDTSYTINYDWSSIQIPVQLNVNNIMITVPIANPSQPNLQINRQNYYAKNLYIIKARHDLVPSIPSIPANYEVIIEHEACTNESGLVYICFLMAISDVVLKPTITNAGLIPFSDIILKSQQYLTAHKKNAESRQKNDERLNKKHKFKKNPANITPIPYINPEDITAKIPDTALIYKDQLINTVIIFPEPIVVKSIGNLNFNVATNIKSGGFFFKDTTINPKRVKINNISIKNEFCSPKKEGFVEGLTAYELTDAFKKGGLTCVPSTTTDAGTTPLFNIDPKEPLARDITNAGNLYTVLGWITPMMVTVIAIILVPMVYYWKFIPYITRKDNDNYVINEDERYSEVVTYHGALLIPIIVTSIIMVSVGVSEDMNFMTLGMALLVFCVIMLFVLLKIMPYETGFINALNIKPEQMKIKYEIIDILKGSFTKINKLFLPGLLIFNKIHGIDTNLKLILWWVLFACIAFSIIITLPYITKNKKPHRNRSLVIIFLFYFCAVIGLIVWIGSPTSLDKFAEFF